MTDTERMLEREPVHCQKGYVLFVTDAAVDVIYFCFVIFISICGQIIILLRTFADCFLSPGPLMQMHFSIQDLIGP